MTPDPANTHATSCPPPQHYQETIRWMKGAITHSTILLSHKGGVEVVPDRGNLCTRILRYAAPRISTSTHSSTLCSASTRPQTRAAACAKGTATLARVKLSDDKPTFHTSHGQHHRPPQPPPRTHTTPVCTAAAASQSHL